MKFLELNKGDEFSFLDSDEVFISLGVDIYGYFINEFDSLSEPTSWNYCLPESEVIKLN